MTKHDAALPSTILIDTASVHLTGKFAGMIEVPLIIDDLKRLDADLDELYLQVEGEDDLLRPAGRVRSNNELRLTFFSKRVRRTARLPGSVHLHWGETDGLGECGMPVAVRPAAIVSF